MNLIDKVLQEEMMIEDTHTIIDSDFSFVDGFMNEQDEARCDKDIPPEEEEDFCNSILDDDDQEPEEDEGDGIAKHIEDETDEF